MVSCINLQRSIPEKQIFSLIFIRTPLTRYEKVIIVGGFNIYRENKLTKDFLQKHTFYNMIKQNTCFKGDGGSCIDLLIKNSKFSYMKTNSFETGLIDHYHTQHTFLKTKFEKIEPKKLYASISSNLMLKLVICNSMYVNFKLTFQINYTLVKSIQLTRRYFNVIRE